MKNKMIKRFALALAVWLAVSLCGCAASGNPAGTSETGTGAATTAAGAASADTADAAAGDYFSNSDIKDVTGETPDAVITLEGASGTISDTTRGASGSTVTITAKGVYRVSGTAENVTITVRDTTKSGNIYLVLDGVTMTNSDLPCILVESADKVIIQCAGENSLTYTAASAEADGAIYARDDVTLNGTGSLTVASSLHGIVGCDDVKITGGTLTVRADSIGIKANDSVRIGGGSVSIVSGHDGVQVDSDDGSGYFYMNDGALTISAGYDGIDVGTDGDSMTGYVRLDGGTIDVTAGGGSAKSKSSATSQKGVKCDGAILVNDGTLTVSAADDAIHSGTDITIAGGALTLSSSDDGVHADNALAIRGGTVAVTKSYEGLEAYEVAVSGGEISVTASDDGINAAGGSDTASTEGWSFRWGGMNTASTGTLTISGGTVYVNAQGDGLDSNGSLYVSGGLVLVEGPTGSGNGALDYGDHSGDVAEITGGTVLAIGSSGMAVNFTGGTQCAALVSLSGTAGTTITVDDGSGFSFTASKSFACAVYSSPEMTKGNSYTITAGSSSAAMDFTASLTYSNVSGMGGWGGGRGGWGGR